MRREFCWFAIDDLLELLGLVSANFDTADGSAICFRFGAVATAMATAIEEKYGVSVLGS